MSEHVQSDFETLKERGIRNNLGRRCAITLCWDHAGLSHDEIAELFHMPSSNSVAQTIRRTKAHDAQILKVLKNQISHKNLPRGRQRRLGTRIAAIRTNLVCLQVAGSRLPSPAWATWMLSVPYTSDSWTFWQELNPTFQTCCCGRIVPCHSLRFIAHGTLQQPGSDDPSCMVRIWCDSL